MSNVLVDGSTTKDRKLDRIKQFDSKSRRYGVSQLLPESLPLRSFTWKGGEVLDQGEEGACVGFGWAAMLSAYPKPVSGIDDNFAKNEIYEEAKTVDEWPGTDYEGTSVLAGAKVVQSLGYISSYHWAFSIEELLRAVAYGGPVVVGVNWYEGMVNPRTSALIKAEGDILGGHCVCVRGVSLRSILPGEKRGLPVVRIRNSWGSSYGRRGDVFLPIEDMEKLLKEQGECCLTVNKVNKVRGFDI